MRLSIVPEIINLYNIKITDEQHVPKEICSPSSFKFNNTFKKPSLIIDNFSRNKYETIEIRRISIDELSKWGYRLVSVLVGRKTRNYPRQIKFYYLEHKNNPIAGAEIIYKLPDNHFIEYDYENKRLRIKGKNAAYYNHSENASKWIELENAKT